MLRYVVEVKIMGDVENQFWVDDWLKGSVGSLRLEGIIRCRVRKIKILGWVKNE